jgi:hypothetical protein
MLGDGLSSLDPRERAGLYTRRSHESSDDDRNASISEQICESEEWAADAGLTIAFRYNEGEGVGASRHSRKRRPVWEQALADLRAGVITTLIVYDCPGLVARVPCRATSRNSSRSWPRWAGDCTWWTDGWTPPTIAIGTG